MSETDGQTDLESSRAEYVLTVTQAPAGPRAATAPLLPVSAARAAHLLQGPRVPATDPEREKTASTDSGFASGERHGDTEPGTQTDAATAPARGSSRRALRTSRRPRRLPVGPKAREAAPCGRRARAPRCPCTPHPSAAAAQLRGGPGPGAAGGHSLSRFPTAV